MRSHSGPDLGPVSYEPCYDDPAKVDHAFLQQNEYWQWIVQAARFG